MKWIKNNKDGNHETFTEVPRDDSKVCPPRAPGVADLEKILADWDHQLDLIKEYEDTYEMKDDNKMTILLTVMPKE